MSEFEDDDKERLAPTRMVVGRATPAAGSAGTAIDRTPIDNGGIPPMTSALPVPSAIPTPIKSPILATGKVLSIVPQNLDEAYRLSEAFVMAGMAPKSYVVEKQDAGGNNIKGTVDHKATCARVMIGIMHGMAIGYAPTIALANIMIINNKACLYGDGASALINKSGIVEYIKTDITGETWGPLFKVTVSLKRKDQSEPIVRSFTYEDAKRAKLLGKYGPWQDYPERQCYWRAWSWAARDGASDALMGLHVAEEVQDYKIEQAREHKLDTSDLDAGLPQITQDNSEEKKE